MLGGPLVAVRELRTGRANAIREFCPNDMVRAVLDGLEPQARAAGVSLSADLAATVSPVRADRVQVHRGLVNLAVNAIEAASGSALRGVRVSTAIRRNDLVFSVQDSGPGIPEEVRDRMFEPFFTTKPRGVGVGLALVKVMARAHGGACGQNLAARPRRSALPCRAETDREAPMMASVTRC